MSATTTEAQGHYGDLRRTSLEQSVLTLQDERMSVTQAFMRTTAEAGPAGIEALLVRLLRLQRAVAACRQLERLK